MALGLVMLFATSGHTNKDTIARDYSVPQIATHVRVLENKIIGPIGKPLFLKIGAWKSVVAG